MKKFFLIMILWVVWPEVIAQEMSHPKIELELTGGISMTSMRGDAKVDEGKGLGFGALIGLELNYHLNDRLTLKSGLLYDYKSTSQYIDYYDVDKLSQAIIPAQFRITRTFNYLTIPVMVQYNFKNSEKNFNYFIEGGGYMSFLTDQNSTNYSGSAVNVVYDEWNDFKKTDSGVSLAVGCRFKVYKSIMGRAKIFNNYGVKNINGIDSKSIIKVNSTYFTLSICKNI